MKTPGLHDPRRAHKDGGDTTQRSWLLPVVLIGLALALAPATASASLIGDTVSCDMEPNGAFWACSPTSATVGAGAEFSLLLLGDPFFAVDLGSETIKLTLISSGSLGMGAGEVLTLSDLDWLPTPGMIVGFTLDFSDSSDFTASDISFGPDSVTMVLNGSSWSPGQMAQITLDVSHVPEPAVLVLLVIGSGVLAAFRLRG